MMTIPVVDLADFLSGDAEKKKNFVTALGKAYEDVGFVAVKNHGISDKEDIPHLVGNTPKGVRRPI
jgi:isopenicillin N synthase-like dioxygenase